MQSWTPASALTGGYNVNLYSLDDGTTENCLGLTAGGDFVHIQRFSAVAGADSISKVMSAFGCTITPPNSPAPGTGINVYVWEDPNDDGNPADGVLISSAAGVITNADNDVLDPFPVPPAAVVGVFHVGVRVPQIAGEFPGPMDTTTQFGAGVAWVTGNGAANTYTGAPVTGTIGLFDVTTIGFPCTWLLRAEGGSPGTVYCTAKVNSLGCTPSIGSVGVPSATLGSGFSVTCINVRNQKSGLLFYKCNGSQNAQAFQGGTLCVGPSGIKRAPVQSSGGAPLPANDCSGSYSTDMNAFAFSAGPPVPDPLLQVNGTLVHCQQWGRDPGFPAPNNTTLSDAVEYTVGP
jgi:hypothetical protein